MAPSNSRTFEYAFSAFGGSGSIVVGPTSVKTTWKGFPASGAFTEQEIPLSELRPEYERIGDRQRVLGWTIASLMAIVGVFGIIRGESRGATVLCVFLLVLATILTARLRWRQKHEFVKFRKLDGKSAVIYSCRSRDGHNFDEFTKRLLETIKNEQRKASCHKTEPIV